LHAMDKPVGRVSASKFMIKKATPKEEVGDESRLIFARIYVQASVFLNNCPVAKVPRSHALEHFFFLKGVLGEG
jgi:hypothetical protein